MRAVARDVGGLRGVVYTDEEKKSAYASAIGNELNKIRIEGWEQMVGTTPGGGVVMTWARV